MANATMEYEWSRLDWVAAVLQHFSGGYPTPKTVRTYSYPIEWHVACETLSDPSDEDQKAASIRKRGRKCGDALMQAVTGQMVADAQRRLIDAGFVTVEFVAPSVRSDEHQEGVLELTLPPASLRWLAEREEWTEEDVAESGLIDDD